MADNDNTMKKIYYDPKTGFGSALELFRKVREREFHFEKLKRGWGSNIHSKFTRNRRIEKRKCLKLNHQEDLGR